MNDNVNPRKQRPLIWIAIVLAATAALALVALLIRRWRRQQAEELRPKAPPITPPAPILVQGLSEAEAEARRLKGQDNAIELRPPRSLRVMLRDNLFNIFNLSLIGLATAQLLLGRPLDALISLGVMLLNIGMNIFQELFARFRLRKVVREARPKATVIRDDKARSVDPSELVLGDVVVVGPGDQLMVDGQVVGDGNMVVDESLLGAEGRRQAKRAGDQVYAGSFCVSGRAACQTQKVGQERLIATLTGAGQTARGGSTPLEHIVHSLMRVLLVIVASLTLLVLARYFRLDPGIPDQVVSDAVSVIFNIAPAGLYFMIFLNYAMGSAELSRFGALVHRTRSVESLASSSVLCFASEGILTGTHVELETHAPPENQEPLAESRIRHILGDFARSTSLDNLTTRAMATTFEGNPRIIYDEVPFMAVYGWSAVAFDDDDLRGLYVLGDPDVLTGHLVAGSQEKPAGTEEGGPARALKQVSAPVGRLFKRLGSALSGGQVAPAQSPSSEPESPALPPQAQGGLSEPGSPAPAPEAEPPEEETTRPNLFRRLSKRLGGVLRRKEAPPQEEEVPQEPSTQEVLMLFAYYPELVPLYTEDGLPQLPAGLVPLCTLHYTERVRPESVATIKGFSEAGVAAKTFSSRAPEKTVALLEAAGVGSEVDLPLGTASGLELASMDPTELASVASEATIFGYLTPEQAGQVVRALRQGGQSVAMVGDGVNDLTAMRAANVSIARQGSSQAALGTADIIILSDSPEVLLRVLNRGQRIVNGLLDVLKLYLTQIFYLLLLILAIALLTRTGFPYRSAQASIVTIVTITIPAIGLSFFATGGVLPTANLRRILIHFVAPAAISIGLAAFGVYEIFLDRTGETAYAQLGLTYSLVAMGLLLVVFIRPPRPFSRLYGRARYGDWRPTLLALALFFLFLVATRVPLAQQLFLIGPLQQPAHYLVIGIAALAWALTVRFAWWVVPLVPRIPVPQPWLGETPGHETSEVVETSEV
jgi:magnesium-transporting ATPase (P-type)